MARTFTIYDWLDRQEALDREREALVLAPTMAEMVTRPIPVMSAPPQTVSLAEYKQRMGLEVPLPPDVGIVRQTITRLPDGSETITTEMVSKQVATQQIIASKQIETQKVIAQGVVALVQTLTSPKRK